MRTSSHVSLMLVACLSAVAHGGVGTVTVLDGSAERTPQGGKAVALAKGAALEAGDLVKVAKGNLKVVLADDSVLMLGEGSELRLDEATFAGKERKGVSLRLLLGALWTHVTKGGRYEVQTERAVAGVRGTTFRVDVLSADPKHPATCVCVGEGKVGVWSGVDAAADAKKEKASAGAGEPPASLSRPGWTPRFTEVAANGQLLSTGKVDLKKLEGHPDAFDAFVQAHQKP